MFSNIFIHFATFLISAWVVSAAPSPGISIQIAGPLTVYDVSNLLLVVTITNIGDQAVTLINDPQGPLSTLPTDKFTITDESGSSPEFNGIYVKYAGVDYVAANGGDEDFTTLAPGQSIDVTHDLSKAYNFTQTGEGNYKFEVNNVFHYVDQAKAAIPLEPESSSIVVTLYGALSAVFHGLDLRKRVGFKDCTLAQQSDIELAAVRAQTYAATALSYLSAHTTATQRYTTWFGQFDATRHNTVRSNFSHINSGLFSTFTYNCSCTLPNIYAYVNPNNYGYITLCPAFWQAPLTGTDSKGGTLVHESSHFNKIAGTKDFAYGQQACRNLALRDPNSALRNADSHEYFAENMPPLP